MASPLKIEAVMLRLIAQRGVHASACPSEVARALLAQGWRELMPQVRDVAWRLREQGLLDITQAGVSLSNRETARGPIRIRQPQSPPGHSPIGESP